MFALFDFIDNSFIYMLKNKGVRRDPCQIPLDILKLCDRQLPHLTEIFLFFAEHTSYKGLWLYILEHLSQLIFEIT